jgi:hypothetical protein
LAPRYDEANIPLMIDSGGVADGYLLGDSSDSDSSWIVFGRTKISRLDPFLTTVRTSYPTQPLLALLHPPVERASG